jgi:hypothetical protein
MTALPLYQPSNRDEADRFDGVFCDRCERDRSFRAGVPYEMGCPILATAMAFSVESPMYPREWVTGENGPMCTAFEGEPTDSQAEALGQATLGLLP